MTDRPGWVRFTKAEVAAAADRIQQDLRDAYPTCAICGLKVTNGRGEPWPSCRCELNDQTYGEGPDEETE